MTTTAALQPISSPEHPIQREHNQHDDRRTGDEAADRVDARREDSKNPPRHTSQVGVVQTETPAGCASRRESIMGRMSRYAIAVVVSGGVSLAGWGLATAHADPFSGPSYNGGNCPLAYTCTHW